MDTIIDEVRSQMPAHQTIDATFAQAASKLIDETLAKHGFAFHTPVDTFSDMLEKRQDQSGNELHVFDCDTSSVLYLAIAENLELPLSMVQIAFFHGDSDHLYIRWRLDDGGILDWDTNGGAQCRTPDNQPPELGRAMSQAELLGYVTIFEAEAWTRAQNFSRAAAVLIKGRHLYPSSALIANNFAWLVSTKMFPERGKYAREALREAKRAVKLVNKPNHLDTLACAYALNGNFSEAIKIEEEATAREASTEYVGRLRALKLGKDCTGIE